MRADEFVTRLEGVVPRGSHKWLARCPAHDDRDPSLSIAERDGRVLICCHAGCSALDVVHAVGLELHDLFQDQDYTPPHAFAKAEMARREKERRWIDRARYIVACAQADREAGKKQSQEDKDLELRAAKYLIQKGVEHDPWVVLRAVRDAG